MDENILIYEVKSGETLENIGARIGMTGDQLKDFHNSHCEKMERLWFNNLVGVKRIIIPKAYQSPDQVNIEKKKELPPSSITRDFYSNSYAVKEIFVSPSQDDLDLDYKVEVSFRSKKETNSADEIINVSCTDFKKNGTKPDDKMSLISLACIEAIYPISFIVPFQGKVSGIFDFENLKDKFKKNRPDLEEFFIGEVYRSYLDKFQGSLESRDHILKQFASSLLYQVLFPKMEWFHKFDSWTEGFYFLQNSFLVKCSMLAEYNHEETEVVETLLRGHIKDAFSLQEILRGKSFDQEPEELADGEIEVRYVTNKKTKKMLEAEASVTFRNDDELYRKQTLKLTQDE